MDTLTGAAGLVNGVKPETQTRKRDAAAVKKELQGREIELLNHLGIDWAPKKRTHINCPFPDHDDKNPSWRWDDAGSRFFCTCAPQGGDVFDVCARLNGWGLAEALAYVEDVFLRRAPIFSCKEKVPEAPGKQTQTAAAGLWEKAGPVADQGERYLAEARGIELPGWPPPLRFSPSLCHRDKDGAFSHRPAIVAAMSKGPGGPVLAIGRIWLAEDGYGKALVTPAKAALGSIKGLACWFGTPGPVLVIVEAIEDALTLLAAGVPFVCAAFTGPNVANVRPPACVKEIVVFGDRAKTGAGIDATGEKAVEAGRPGWEAAGAFVRSACVSGPHKDPNELLMSGAEDWAAQLLALLDAPRDGGRAADQRDDRAQTADIHAELRELAALDDASFTLSRAEHARRLGLSQTDLKRLVKAERRKTLKASSPSRPAAVLDWPDLKRGEPNKRSQENIEFYLAHIGAALSYDEMAQRLIVSRDGEETTMTDAASKALWLGADRLGLQAAEPYFMAVIENLARQNGFHPLRAYLDGLAWDGVRRLDSWLASYLGAEDAELHAAYGRKHLIAAVRRVRKPGSKYDTILVLQGRQGQGKSSVIRALCPSDEYFSDSLSVGADRKEIMEACAGKWLVELAELDGMGKRDAGTVKAMLSRQVDEARLAYGRHRSEFPRQFILFGTVNDAHFLRDATGNRRFWPVSIKPMADADEIVRRIVRDRDQLWAEAAHYESQGESVTLPRHLWETAAESQRARMIIDPWQEKLEAHLAGRPGFTPTDEIYMALGVSSEKQNVQLHKRVYAILTELGYERKQRRVSGKPTWGFENVLDTRLSE
jgi:hypothetical protein